MTAYIQIDDLRPTPPSGGYAPFALGFRPFFLAAGIAGAVLMALWLAVLKGLMPPPVHFASPVAWHGHEMIFGYTMAVVAGFLLTAVKNWTGVQTIHGTPLALLALLWLAGRIGFFLPLPGPLIAALDIAFLPLLALAIAVPILRVRHWKSIVFVAILLAMACANALSHLDALGILPGISATAGTLGANLVMVLVALMGGRVIPFFTERALPGFVSRSRPWVENTAVAAIAVHVAAELLAGDTPLPVVTGLLAAALNGIRLAGWWTPRLLRVPLLWTLHLAYGWLVAGLALRSGALLDLLTASTALHALTVGCLGLVTLGMMARVALGHSGREIQVGWVMVVSFLLMAAAGVVRVLGPALMPAIHMGWVALAGLLWIGAFAIFIAVYTPILLKARIDGRPG